MKTNICTAQEWKQLPVQHRLRREKNDVLTYENKYLYSTGVEKRKTTDRGLMSSSSVQNGIYALGKVHMCSTAFLRGFPNVACDTVPEFVWMTVAIYLNQRWE